MILFEMSALMSRASAYAIAVTVLISVVNGCSNMMMVPTPYDGEVISARTMDWNTISDNVTTWHMTAVRKGAMLPVLTLDPNGTASGLALTGYPAKYSFYCGGFPAPKVGAHSAAAALVTPAQYRSNWPSMCGDGLNSAGFSVGVLWDETSGNIAPSFNATGPKLAINAVDLMAYALATFATVDEFISAFKNQDVAQIVYPDYLQDVFAYVMGFSQVSVHIVVHDKFGKTGVLEWVNGTTNVFNAFINPDNIIANAPQVPMQQVLLAKEMTAAMAQCINSSALAEEFNIEGVNCTNDWGLESNGGFYSWERYERLYGLRAAVQNDAAVYPTDSNISPYFKNDKKRSATVTAINLINTVVIPGDYELGPLSFTQWTAVRDHVAGYYYMRPASSPTFSRFDLVDVDKMKPRFKSVDMAKATGSNNWYIPANMYF